jgi:hypothetical protein
VRAHRPKGAQYHVSLAMVAAVAVVTPPDILF